MPVEQLETNFSHLSHGDYILKVDGIADILLNHPRYPLPWPDVVPDPHELKDQLNDMRRALSGAQASAGAENGSDIDAIRGESQQSVILVGQYLVMKSIREKDPTMFQDTGLLMKTRSYNKAPNVVSTAPTGLMIKHGPLTGTALVTTDKIVGAASTEVQVTEDPTNEGSWRSAGMHKTSHRMPVQGLTEATKCYFRVRGHGATGPGPWSEVASLVIL